MIGPNYRCVTHHVQCSHTHAAQVRDYRAERQRQVTEMEESQDTYGYTTEVAEYKRTHGLITFKEWLIGQAHRQVPA